MGLESRRPRDRIAQNWAVYRGSAMELADDFGRKVRDLVTDPLHRTIFPLFVWRMMPRACGGSAQQPAAHNYAVGRGGSLTGRGADLLLIDDPLKDREEAQSETIRRSLHHWYATVAYTRVQPGAAIVLVQTRWHEDDLAGWLLRSNSENWEVLSFPAIAETDEGFRRAGEALWPQRFSLDALRQIRVAIGGAAWASLYQQRPAAAEGAIFRRDWFLAVGDSRV